MGFVILLGISMIYGVLIYGIGEQIQSQEEVSVKAASSKVNRANELRQEISAIVEGYPMENMARYISKQDRKTAAFVVGVAKKESNWGKYTPKKDGQECYNYWGYRGRSENMTPGGYTCFSSPKEAVAVVSKRFDTLIKEEELDTPEKMVVWKCGWSCAGHDPARVSKWIQDVEYYYGKIN